MENQMFCFQCQETAGNKGCNVKGICGKDATLANLQDTLVYATKGLSLVAAMARNEGIRIEASLNEWIVYNLFMTITNANFDHDIFVKRIFDTLTKRDQYLTSIQVEIVEDALTFQVQSKEEMLVKAKEIGILTCENEDLRSLRELVINGLKGLCAYVQHASVLHFEDEEINLFIQKTLVSLLEKELTMEQLIEMTMNVGKFGVSGMELLDKANTTNYGSPEISTVDIGVGTRPGILISGHDLQDLQWLLEQSEGQGIDIYTHSEMLPAHYYPAFKKYTHFKGNYGNAWWQQKEEFASFNGPILMTTNCIVPVQQSYADRMYTTGATGYPNCPHIDLIDDKKDFSQIIEQAKTCLPPKEIEQGSITGGFAHSQVIALAPQIIEAVNTGAIKKFVVMAGCDGRHKKREYYTDFAKALPKDTVILTAGCAKYRYNKLDLGDINGIPRVLDAGQCNDSYSLAMIAMALKDAFQLDDINDLPIIYNIAWYEQKAVIVLLSLLHLGVKNIHLGPTLPGFLSTNVTNFLVETFKLAKIQEVESDMALFFEN